MTLKICDMCKRPVNKNKTTQVELMACDENGFIYPAEMKEFCENCFTKIKKFIKDNGNNLEDLYDIL